MPTGARKYPRTYHLPDSPGIGSDDSVQHDLSWLDGELVVTEKLEHAREQVAKSRSNLDLLDLLISWLAFAWGVGKTGNPLLEGLGIPSAALVEMIVGASDFELTPGLSTRSSCPEAIWQAAKWWHKYHETQQGLMARCLEGVFHVEHRL